MYECVDGILISPDVQMTRLPETLTKPDEKKCLLCQPTHFLLLLCSTITKNDRLK